MYAAFAVVMVVPVLVIVKEAVVILTYGGQLLGWVLDSIEGLVAAQTTLIVMGGLMHVVMGHGMVGGNGMILQLILQDVVIVLYMEVDGGLE
tara:strand:+ start:167 stop:442 length:276 start_codon:yes stop_codon:yes gene_type:complete